MHLNGILCSHNNDHNEDGTAKEKCECSDVTATKGYENPVKVTAYKTVLMKNN